MTSTTPQRPVTMREVAAHAGVAVSTVSRVVSQPDRISPKTRESVQQAMRELGYAAPLPDSPVPPVQSVAVLIPDITNPFYFDLIRGSQNRLRDSGYTQVLIEDTIEVESAFLDLMHSTVGAILVAPRLDDDRIRAAAEQMPIVTVNRIIEGVPGVLVDSAVAVEQAIHHLASLGHQRICYVGGPDHSWTSQERWQACERAAEPLGLEVLKVGPFTPQTISGAAAADTVLTTRATAAIAFNDLLAIGMLQRFAARGVRVPDQISVVGCDDIFGSDFCNPPLTTMSGLMTQAGREATDQLISYAQGRGLPGRTVRLPSHLTIRQSTGPAPTGTSA